MPDYPCLKLAVAQLADFESQQYVAWVLHAPYPGGYVLHNRPWTEQLEQTWQAWQSFFPLRGGPTVPFVSTAYTPPPISAFSMDTSSPVEGQPTSYTVRIMQQLGVTLWQWLFDGPILNSFNQSQGIAIGQKCPLRLRLEIRDPDLIALPWEIMQPQPGRQPISVSSQHKILFSRTTNEVDSLPPQRSEQFLRVLLVLGHNPEAPAVGKAFVGASQLDLEQEAATLSRLLESAGEADLYNGSVTPVACQVKTLIEPTPAELVTALATGGYNVLFYSGHGVPAPDGGLLMLAPDAAINGTELAQVLVRHQVKLAVFNACWGAQPDQRDGKSIPRSSLAEVLIHHGVPAVLGMRDSITDQEALSFIQVFAQQLARRSPIDEAVAVARQNLLTLYRFNQPAWTLPVLYMHPEFDGELIKPYTEGVTEIPDQAMSWYGRHTTQAYLRSLAAPPQVWSLRGGIMRVGRGDSNDVVLQQPYVSREHAEIFYRDSASVDDPEPTYLLRDRSRCGTWISNPASPTQWMRVHNREVPLSSKTQLKFGDPSSQTLEFVIDAPSV
jgi:hypothetical protein